MSDHQQGNNERNENKDIEGQFPSKVVEFVSKPLVRSFLGWYEGILVFCRAIAVSLLDPLFFYVPVINEDKKCIGLNKVLWTIAIVSRSVTDFIYLVHYVVISVVKSKKSKIRKERNDESNSKERNIRVKSRSYFWPFFMLNILVILPIPQVVMSSIFSEMRRTKSSNITILNSLVLLQYGPRVFQIYRSWKKLISAEKFNEASLWIKASFNLFLYILAGHVLGAFWYFFSTQRLAACWQKACDQIHNDGVEISFNCDYSFRNLSFLDDFCPIDTPNPSTFDFGIFLEARRSRSLESTGFLPKAFYCFWWGMRNLSSFGSNLQTSSYIWENIFALGISIFGLLLFLYFIGNLQLKIIKDSGLAKHESLLLKICDSLQPMFYNKYCYIVREGDPIDAVFFITAGTVWTYTSNNGEGSESQHTEHLKDQYFGGELLELVLTSTSGDISNLSKVQVFSKTLKTYTKVEAFALMAHDLKRIWQSNRINPSALTCPN
ncbi:cyclic nucleotide-gated ion channel 1-like isoform X2 [Quercus lobata]|uniref:cyclic nucleotide-gated ion channel 1-like isoform X2 n=1 Tax=Quercus lobata TaxID=97700 RepID=UPI001245DB00|nr:cyclic nucleotide-gated ion channel 1-like isoform X2 [Quercus lobata]